MRPSLVVRLVAAALTVRKEIFKMIPQIALLFTVQYYVALSLPPCAAIVYVVQKMYLRTSRQLRYLELESRSAVYSSLLDTVRPFLSFPSAGPCLRCNLVTIAKLLIQALDLSQDQGLSTIRAFGWQDEAADENMAQLDASQRPFYLRLCLQRWLNVVVDSMVAVVAVAVVLLAVGLRETTGAEMGVALNLILVANTTLLRLVQAWTNVEISLGAVARLREAAEDTPREDLPKEVLEPDESWPSAGGDIEFVGVTAAYE